MIVNGLDITGYEYVKFTYSPNINHNIEGSDILLSGTKSDDFGYLFPVIKSVDIKNTDYISLESKPSLIGNILVTPKVTSSIMFDVIVTNETKVIESDSHCIIFINNSTDPETVLNSINSNLVELSKVNVGPIGSCRSQIIKYDFPITREFEDFVKIVLSDKFRTSINYTSILNVLNSKLLELLPEFNLIVGKKDRDNTSPLVIRCDYDGIKKDQKKMFRRLRRHMLHKISVNYEFKINDTTRYLKMFYEMSNYDFITNICQLSTKDFNGIDHVFAIHWTLEDVDLDLQDPKNGGTSVANYIKAKAEIHYNTKLDRYINDIITKINIIYSIFNNETYSEDEVVISNSGSIESIVGPSKPSAQSQLNSLDRRISNLEGDKFLTSANTVENEIPIGLIDGQNSIFKPKRNFIPESLEVFSNGLKQVLVEDYIISNDSIILNFSPNLNEELTINYGIKI